MKQLVPTSFEEYIAEHHEGDVVTGRIAEISGGSARVELGEGIHATCPVPAEAPAEKTDANASQADLSSLTSMLQARWKGQASSVRAKHEPPRAGQIRSFRMTKLDAAAKKIEVEITE
jgi:small subunit ribosomal protein S1